MTNDIQRDSARVHGDVMPAATYHTVPVETAIGKRYMVARETTHVEYWSGEKEAWVFYPDGSTYATQSRADAVRIALLEQGKA